MNPVTSSSSIGAPGAGVLPASAAGPAPATGPSFDDVFRHLSGGDLPDAVPGAGGSRLEGAGEGSGPAPDARATGSGEATEPGAPAPLAATAAITVAVALVLPLTPDAPMAEPPEGATLKGDSATSAVRANAEPRSAASRGGAAVAAGYRAPVLAIEDTIASADASAGTGASSGATAATTTTTSTTTELASASAASSATPSATASVPARVSLPVQGRGEDLAAVTPISGGVASGAATAAATDPSADDAAPSGLPAFRDMRANVAARAEGNLSRGAAGSGEARAAGRHAGWSEASGPVSTPSAEAAAQPPSPAPGPSSPAPAPAPMPAAAASASTASAPEATRHAAALLAPLLGAPASDLGRALGLTGASAPVADTGTPNGAHPHALDAAAAAQVARVNAAAAGIDLGTATALPDEAAALVATALRGQHPATSAALRAFKQAGGVVPVEGLAATLATVANAALPALSARVSDLTGAAADGVAPAAAPAGEPERRVPLMTTILAPALGADLRVASDLGGAWRVADADRPRSAPLDGESVHAQIVQSLRVQWSGGSGEARVTLRPGYLGEVTATIKVDHGAVTATLQADTPEVRRWMEANTQTLRDALLEHGLKLDRLVVAEPTRGQAADDRQGRPRGRQQPDPHPRPRRPRDDDANATFDLNP